MPPIAEQSSRGNSEPQAVPYRLRKPAQFFAMLTLSDASKLVEESGQRDMLLRMAHAARQLEAAGQHCDSLAELAAVSHLEALPELDASGRETQRLQSLLKDAVELADKLGQASHDAAMRALYFNLCRHCQRATTEIGRQRLWNEKR